MCIRMHVRMPLHVHAHMQVRVHVHVLVHVHGTSCQDAMFAMMFTYMPCLECRYMCVCVCMCMSACA
jgi:hypothetical protein